MSSVHRWLFPLAVAFALAAPVYAQSEPAADAGTDTRSAVSSTFVTTLPPELDPTSGMERSALETTSPTYTAPELPGVNESQDVALMIVGGAALIIGSVIGGDAGTLMMVGGGVIGLVGLYGYVQ